MEHFPAPLTTEQSDRFAVRIAERIESDGYGLRAAERIDNERFIGFIGLMPTQFDARFTPAIEVGWRLAPDHWGEGLATEGAIGAVRFGFDRFGPSEIVSFTVPANTRSIAVMKRIGMTRDPADDFDHPRFPEGHRLRRHVLFRIERS